MTLLTIKLTQKVNNNKQRKSIKFNFFFLM